MDEPKLTTVEFQSKSATLVSDVLLRIGGHDITHFATGLVLRAEAGEFTRFEVRGIPRHGVSFTLPADVTVNIEIIEPGVLECHDKGKAGKRWVFRRFDRIV